MEIPWSLTIFLSVLCVTGTLSASIDGRNRLEILPGSGTQTKSIGSSIILTCKPEVENIQLVSNIEWINPHNEVIENRKLLVLPLNSHNIGGIKPSIYTEKNHVQGSMQLFFNSLKEEEAGQYICRATYANQLITNVVNIQAIVAITWDDAPENQYPIQGESYAIKCQVRAKPPPQVDWIYNNEVIRTNEHYVVEPYALRINDVTPDDDGIYTCRASVLDTGELQERAIRVEVHIKPTINELRNVIEVIEGESANIDCNGTGKPPPKFSWTKSIDQKDLSHTDRFMVNEITGSLSITKVDREDESEYQCTAENPAGRVSKFIQVNVIVKPKISEFVNRTFAQDGEAIISCDAFGKPPPEITFRKHTSDKPFIRGRQPEDDRITLTNEPNEVKGVTTGILKIDRALRSDDGLYECIAENRGGNAFKNGHLTIEFPPTFELQPNRTIWSWNQRSVNLTCQAVSIPNATIEWFYYHDQKVDRDNNLKVFGNGPESILNVIPSERRYYTSYKCIATNRHGKAEKNIELREATIPGEVLQARVKDVTATSFIFEIVPPEQEPDLPLYTINVEYKERQQPWTQARNKSWSVNSFYILEDLKPQTEYEFRFSASNEVGRGQWAKNLFEATQIKSKPTQPRFSYRTDKEYIQSEYSDKFEAKWLAAIDNGEPIDYYIVRYCHVIRYSNSEWHLESSTCKDRDTKKHSYWLTDLNPDTYYKIQVAAHNALGNGEPAELIFRTNRGNASVLHHQGPLISSGAIIGIVVTLLIIILIIIDAVLCCSSKSGIIYFFYERSQKKPVDEDDSKLGRDEKEPLKEEKIITPIINSGLHTESSVTFDGKRSISKTGFVGKDSAV